MLRAVNKNKTAQLYSCHRITGSTDIRKTALIEACELGNLEMTSLLLSKGADVDRSMCRKRDNTTDDRMIASANENIDVVEALLSKGTTTENLKKHNALCIAISNGHINVVQFLLEKGIYIIYDMFSDKPLPLTLAGQLGQPGILARLISIMVARQKAFEGRHDFFIRAINANMFPGLTDCERVYPRQWVHLLTDVSKVTLFTWMGWIEARIADERACYLALNSVSLQQIIHDRGVLSETWCIGCPSETRCVKLRGLFTA